MGLSDDGLTKVTEYNMDSKSQPSLDDLSSLD
jgi:hypothetical protein